MRKKIQFYKCTKKHPKQERGSVPNNLYKTQEIYCLTISLGIKEVEELKLWKNVKNITFKMAAHTSAAAYGSLVWCSVWSLLLTFLGNVLGQANYVYSRQELINYGLQINGVITQDFHRANNIPMDIARPLGCPWIVVGSVKQWRWRRERKQKRGCRAGLLARL